MHDSRPNHTDILTRFAALVAKSLRIDASKVTEDAYLDDLGAESLDFIEISLDTEDEFAISLPEKNILETALPIFGDNVLEKDGVLTEDGKKLFLHRMPELAPVLQNGGLTVDELKHQFLRVGTWVRMIQGLMEQRPQACAKCGTALNGAQAGLMTCKACGEEYEIPYGEELNKRWLQEYYETEYRPARTSETI